MGRGDGRMHLPMWQGAIPRDEGLRVPDSDLRGAALLLGGVLAPALEAGGGRACGADGGARGVRPSNPGAPGVSPRR